MPSLGIFVTRRDGFDHVLGLARAAHRAGVHTDVFFSGDGVHQTQEARFGELVDLARVGVCEVSFRDRGFAGSDVPGLSDRDFVTQGRNAEMVETCDRYLTL